MGGRGHVTPQSISQSVRLFQFVTRGDPATGKFSVCYFKYQRLLAIDSVNRPADHMAGRKLLASATSLTAEQAADLGVDLKHYL